MAFSRWVGWAREMYRVIRGLPDEELRRKTAAIHEQLIRLRQHRAAHEKEREVSMLRDVRKIVEEMKTLERNLAEAEKATVEYVDAIGEQVSREMEAKLNAEMDQIVNKAMTTEFPDLQKQTSAKSAGIPSGSSPSGPKQ
ncbi:unnamed protein product [Calypogeia fissa]